MKREQLYKELTVLQPQIDERLSDLSFSKIKELMLWLAKSESYQRVKKWDNQLRMLDFFCSIWLEEKKQLPQIGIEDDIFYGIHSLEDIERKYQSLYFGMMRFETRMPEEYHEQVIDTIINYRVSGIALGRLIVRETSECEKNVIQVASMLREREQLITAMILLEEAVRFYPKSEAILLELAECWILGKQWGQAVECLKKIVNPDQATEELIKELEKRISDENL